MITSEFPTLSKFLMELVFPRILKLQKTKHEIRVLTKYVISKCNILFEIFVQTDFQIHSKTFRLTRLFWKIRTFPEIISKFKRIGPESEKNTRYAQIFSGSLTPPLVFSNEYICDVVHSYESYDSNSLLSLILSLILLLHTVHLCVLCSLRIYIIICIKEINGQTLVLFYCH